MGIALGELAVRFGCELRGDPELRVDHVAALGTAGPGSLSFLANPRMAHQLAQSRATAVVVDERAAAGCPAATLVHRNPHALFARIAALLHPLPPLQPGVHADALVDPRARIDPGAEVGPLCVIGADAVIGERCYLGPGCVIGAGVRIGADSRLVARVTLLHGVQLAERVLVHPGAVIGADGFGYARDGAQWLKVPQIGGVRVGADVEIGANTTIDRGAIERHGDRGGREARQPDPGGAQRAHRRAHRHRGLHRHFRQRAHRRALHDRRAHRHRRSHRDLR